MFFESASFPPPVAGISARKSLPGHHQCVITCVFRCFWFSTIKNRCFFQFSKIIRGPVDQKSDTTHVIYSVSEHPTFINPWKYQHFQIYTRTCHQQVGHYPCNLQCFRTSTFKNTSQNQHSDLPGSILSSRAGFRASGVDFGSIRSSRNPDPDPTGPIWGYLFLSIWIYLG